MGIKRFFSRRNSDSISSKSTSNKRATSAYISMAKSGDHIMPYLASTWDLIDGMMRANVGIIDLIFSYLSRIEIKVIDEWNEHAEDAKREENS